MSQTPFGAMPPANQAPPPKSGPGVGTIIAIIAVVGVAVILVCGGVLTVILLPALGKAREAAREIRDMTQARLLVSAVITYSADHRDALPPPEGWTTAMAAYLNPPAGSTATLNPLDSSRIEGPTPDWIYRPLPAREGAPGGRMADAYFPSEWVLFYEDVSRLPATTDTVIVAFLDGSVRSVTRAELQALLERPATPTGPGPTTPANPGTGGAGHTQGGESPRKSTGKN